MTLNDLIIISSGFIVLLLVAVKIMSDKLCGRIKDDENVFGMFSVVLACFAILFIPIYIEALYFYSFDLWRFLLNAMVILIVYIVLSYCIAFFKAIIDYFNKMVIDS